MQRGAVMTYHLIVVKALLNCVPIVIGVAVALGKNDFSNSIGGSHPGWRCALNTDARRVEPIFNGQRAGLLAHNVYYIVMDLNAFLEPITNFFSSELFTNISRVFHDIFQFFYPANSEAAHK